jgi:tRNA(Arg) A34 adenosine deaminase TadA
MSDLLLQTAETADPMALALAEAGRAAARGEVPVGAVLVDGATGQVLAVSGNRVEELHDPTAHAELLVLRAAAAAGAAKRLPEADLYVTLEPCPMCAQAIAFARLRRVYFGAYDPKGGGVDHGPRIFLQPTCHHRPEIYGGIREREAAELLQDFFRARRNC